MANEAQEKRVPLSEVHKLLQARGLRPSDYKHLPYKEQLKLAGLDQ